MGPMPLNDAMKLRLTASVWVQDDAGQRHLFGPDDEVPAWARAKISNPAAWGYRLPRNRGPVTDYGPQVRLDELPGFIDVLCSAKHRRRIIARFEPGLPLDGAPGEQMRWDWHWTTARVPGGVETLADGNPAPDRQGSWDGQHWVFKDVETDHGPGHAVVHGPEGQMKARFRCCGLDVPIQWDRWAGMLDQMRHARRQEVELSELAATMTR